MDNTDWTQIPTTKIYQLEAENRALENQHTEDVTEIERLRREIEDAKNRLADNIAICNLLGELTAEIERLKAQPKRVVDVDQLEAALKAQTHFIDGEGQVLDYEDIDEIIDSLAIPQPDYMGAMRTLAKKKQLCYLCKGKACKNDDVSCAQQRIAYALAHPTEEGK